MIYSASTYISINLLSSANPTYRIASNAKLSNNKQMILIMRVWMGVWVWTLFYIDKVVITK